MSDTPARGPTQPIIFRVVADPAGWRIIGADAVPMSTLYLSRKLATEHAKEMVEVLKNYGQQAQVIVEGGCPAN
jgi:hypothetical protein